MTYDLAVWEGDRPADDEAGMRFYLERIIPALGAYDPRKPIAPTPRIRAYIEALLERWPDITDDDDSTPWATSPLMGVAVGWFAYFPMVFSMADEASAFAAGLARQHGLICFGPQLRRLRP
jgi:hypothetical protein